jgi:hypothetical protein
MYPTQQQRETRLEYIQEMLYSLAVSVAEEGSDILELKKKIDVLEFERKILTDIEALERLNDASNQ